MACGSTRAMLDAASEGGDMSMPTDTLTRHGRETAVTPSTRDVAEVACRQLDVRGRTITTGIVWAVRERLAELEVGDEIDLDIDPFPALAPDLEAWCRATGHELVDLRRNGESWRIRLRKGEPRRNEHRLALVVSTDDLTELLSPLGFALAAALGGAQVSVYLLGPAVHLLAPGFRARLHGVGPRNSIRLNLRRRRSLTARFGGFVSRPVDRVAAGYCAQCFRQALPQTDGLPVRRSQWVARQRVRTRGAGRRVGRADGRAIRHEPQGWVPSSGAVVAVRVSGVAGACCVRRDKPAWGRRGGSSTSKE
jgi:TusA-related sulfurtransferase